MKDKSPLHISPIYNSSSLTSPAQPLLSVLDRFPPEGENVRITKIWGDVFQYCVFADPKDLRLPLTGIVCPICGLIQGEDSDHCVYCNTKLNSSANYC